MDERETRRPVAALNDAFRQAIGTPAALTGQGRYLMTSGVSALPASTIRTIWDQVRAYDTFTPDNDPYGEHDFGVLELKEPGKVFWKIDYYDKDLVYGSLDPDDPEQTTRVLTVMLSHEY